jgi:hypothetical protein
MRLYSGIWSLCSLGFVRTAVTVWTQTHMGQPTNTASAAAANHTGAAAYDPTVLTAPAIPNPAPPNAFFLQLFNSNTSQAGLSIVQKGSFFGFSIEMSVINQVRKYDSSWMLRLVFGLNSNDSWCQFVSLRPGDATSGLAMFCLVRSSKSRF